MTTLLERDFSRSQLGEYGLDPSCVLAVPLWKRDAASFVSDDAYGHLCTRTGALWRPDGHSFDGDDYITLNDGSAGSPLNFTSGDFSYIFRVKFNSVAAWQHLLCRGLQSTDGYRMAVDLPNGRSYFETSQAGTNQGAFSTTGNYVADTWYTIGFSRAGSDARHYRNGVDITTGTPNHTNPATSTRTTKIAVYDDKITQPLDGVMEVVLGYSRALSASEHMNMHLVLASS